MSEKRGFSKLDPQSHTGKTTTWLTPLWLINALGKFDLDPCAFPGHKTAARLIAPPRDGLRAKWTGRVWLNPPYGRDTYTWLSKLEKHDNGTALVFARTDTIGFHDLRPDAVFFLKGRIKFLDRRKRESTNAGHGSMLLIYGSNNFRHVVSAAERGGLEGTLWKRG